MNNINLKQSGFTLVELMITVGIAAILTKMAIPSFTGLISNSRLTASTNDFVGALTFAKSEAVKRGIRVALVSKSGIDNDWSSGWDIIADTNGDNNFTLPPADQPCVPGAGLDCWLRTHSALPNGYTFQPNGNSYRVTAVYLPSGLTGSGAATFTLCDDTQNGAYSRQIVISLMGRARVATPPAVLNANWSCP